MQNSNSIYEIARLIKDKDYIQNDIAQVMRLVTDFFRNKYITSLESEIKAQSNNIKNNPSKEIRLLALMKEFMPEQSHSDIDNLINTITTVSAISSIRKKINPDIPSPKENIIRAAAVDPSVKADGVYDIDENCRISTQSAPSFNFPSMLVVIFLIALLAEFN